MKWLTLPLGTTKTSFHFLLFQCFIAKCTEVKQQKCITKRAKMNYRQTLYYIIMDRLLHVALQINPHGTDI